MAGAVWIAMLSETSKAAVETAGQQLESQSIIESENHRMLWVGRDL